MQIKLLVSAAAIALVAGVGSASAAEQFTTLKGISTDVMTPQEMAIVIGAQFSVQVVPSGAFTPAVFNDHPASDGLANRGLGSPGEAAVQVMNGVVFF